MPLKRNIYFKRREIEGLVISGDFRSEGKELVTTTWNSKIDTKNIWGLEDGYSPTTKKGYVLVPSRQRSHIPPNQKRKAKSSISKVPAGRGYVSFQESINSLIFGGCPWDILKSFFKLRQRQHSCIKFQVQQKNGQYCRSILLKSSFDCFFF